MQRCGNADRPVQNSRRHTLSTLRARRTSRVSHVDVLVAARAAKIVSEKRLKCFHFSSRHRQRVAVPLSQIACRSPFSPRAGFIQQQQAPLMILYRLSLPSLRTPGLAKRSACSTGSVTRAVAHFGLLRQPCLAMPCHVGWPILAWCDRHHLLPIRLLVRRTLRELGWPRIPGVQHRHNRWPRRIPPSMVENMS
jgi:hypothetical protein